MKNKYMFLVLMMLIGTILPPSISYAKVKPLEIGITGIKNFKSVLITNIFKDLNYGKSELITDLTQK